MSTNKIKSSEKTSNYSHHDSFKIRKSMLRSLEAIQKNEHHALLKISAITITNKEKILILLSDWLCEKSFNATKSEVDEIDAISKTSHSEWSFLVKSLIAASADHTSKSAIYKEKHKIYRTMAPLGGVFASAEEKPIIDSARNESICAKSHMDSAASLLNNAHTNVQKFGREFMTNCTQNMTMLNKSKALGKETGDIVKTIKEEIDLVWRDLCGGQVGELENIKYGSYYHSCIYND
jgi:hypothetical protein